MEKIAIYGMGNVGKSLLLSLCLKEKAEIGIIDRDPKKNQALLLDFLPFSNKIVDATESNLSDYTFLFLTVGISLNSNRDIFLKQSKKMIDPVIKDIIERGFKGNLIIVSNPTDVLCSYISRNFRKEFKNVLSTGTIIDSMRLRKNEGKYIKLYGPHGPGAILNNKTFLNKESLDKALEVGCKISEFGFNSSYGICLAALKLYKILTSRFKKAFIASFYNDLFQVAFSHQLILKRGKVYSRPISCDDLNPIELKDFVQSIEQECKVFELA